MTITRNGSGRRENGERLAVLHLLLTMGETSAGYNEHCLPMVGARDITVCTYFRPLVQPPAGITLFAGDSTPAGFARAVKAALRARDYDIVHAHSVHMSLFFLLAASTLRPGLLSRSTCTLHSSFPNYKLRNRLLLLPSFAFHRRVVCCSSASYESFPPALRRLAGSRLRVVANGLDLDRVDAVISRTAPDPGDRPFTVASVGRLMEIKDPMTALDAFLEQDDGTGRLAFVGEGPLRGRLQEHSRTRNAVGRVELAGLVPREDVYGRLMNSDVFISTSRVEGLPVAVVEAMACRLPVILSDIPPHREITAGADFLPLIPVGDAAGFARELRRLRLMTASERAGIGQRCRALVEQRFSLGAMRAGYDQVYREVLGERAPAAAVAR